MVIVLASCRCAKYLCPQYFVSINGSAFVLEEWNISQQWHPREELVCLRSLWKQMKINNWIGLSLTGTFDYSQVNLMFCPMNWCTDEQKQISYCQAIYSLEWTDEHKASYGPKKLFVVSVLMLHCSSYYKMWPSELDELQQIIADIFRLMPETWSSSRFTKGECFHHLQHCWWNPSQTSSLL